MDHGSRGEQITDPFEIPCTSLLLVFNQSLSSGHYSKNVILTQNIVRVGFDHWNLPFVRQHRSFPDRPRKWHCQSRNPAAAISHFEPALYTNLMCFSESCDLSNEHNRQR